MTSGQRTNVPGSVPSRAVADAMPFPPALCLSLLPSRLAPAATVPATATAAVAAIAPRLWLEAQERGGGRPRQQPAHPQYANYWAPLTRKRHSMPHSAQSQHANCWAPRTRKRHQQEHRPQRPTESSDPTQHAKGRTGDRPGPRKGATTRRNVTQGGHIVIQKVQWCPHGAS